MEIREVKYPNILTEMFIHRESQRDLAKILKISQVSVWRKLMGFNEWKISEINILCKHYNKKYEQLFK